MTRSLSSAIQRYRKKNKKICFRTFTRKHEATGEFLQHKIADEVAQLQGDKIVKTKPVKRNNYSTIKKRRNIK